MKHIERIHEQRLNADKAKAKAQNLKEVNVIVRELKLLSKHQSEPETEVEEDKRSLKRLIDYLVIGVIAIFFYKFCLQDGSKAGFAFIQLTLIFIYVVLSILYYLRIRENKMKIQRSMKDESNI